MAPDARGQSHGGTASGTGGSSGTSAAASAENGAFAVDGASGMPGGAIPLRVRLPAAFSARAASKAAYTFLMFKGLPEGFLLNAGFQTRNTWLVSINDIRDLKMTVPQEFQGAFNVDAYLYRGKGFAPYRSAFQVRIALPGQSLPTSTTYAGGASSSATQDATIQPRIEAPLSRKEEEELFAQGEAELHNGNIVFARLLFEELVSHGNVRGLFALAKTYDPAVLQQLGAVGIQGDAQKARELYRKASEFAGIPAPE